MISELLYASTIVIGVFGVAMLLNLARVLGCSATDR